ncbi:MAG: hypothetical protein IPG70_04910, partial [Moraxellaceae bacterium]|nr:hypothetical protein [Moraxellaceae bacterium]
DNNAGTNNNTASQLTNSVNFLVTQTADVAANDSLTLNTLIGDDTTINVTTANQGTTVSFSNIIWNNGNGADSFAISYANAGGSNGFPAGTSFQLFQADGVNVLPANTTPVIQPGLSYTVVLKATLPAGALPGNNLGNKFTVVKTATSITDPTKSDFVNDTLDNITANVVDLSNHLPIDLPYVAGTLGAGGATDAGTLDNSGAAWSTPQVLIQVLRLRSHC